MAASEPLVADVLWQIAESVVAGESLETAAISQSSRSTLLSLACSCKAFEKPALALLWRYQGDLTRILELMWVLELDDETRTLWMAPVLKFDRPGKLLRIDDEASNVNWSTVARYAPYVWTLSLKLNWVRRNDPVSSKNISWILGALLSRVDDCGAPLFPNLRRLEFSHSSPLAGFLPAIVPRSLRVFHFVLNTSPSETDPELHVAFQHLINNSMYSPEELVIEGSARSTDKGALIRTVVPLFSRLEGLRADSVLHSHFVYALAALPHLRSLNMHVDDDLLVDAFPANSFSALENLGMTCSPQSGLAVMSRIFSRRLRRLGITINSLIGTEAVRSIFEAVVEAGRSNLDQFSFVVTIPGSGEVEDLLPLLQCRQLKQIMLTELPLTSVKDPHTELMVHAWPQLTRLTLLPSFGFSPPGHPPDATTTLSLRALSEHPNLSDLTIYIEHLGPLLEVQPPTASASHLTKLCIFTRSTIASPREVAQQIARFFPRLDISKFRLCFLGPISITQPKDDLTLCLRQLLVQPENA